MPEGPSENYDNEESDFFVEGDPMLNLLITLAHKGMSTGLTVYSGGLIFTGMLVSMDRFIEENVQIVNGKAESLEIMFGELLQATKNENSDATSGVPSWNFVHLIEARVLTPGQPSVPQSGVPIRILRSKVTGWSIGTLSEG